MSWTPWIIAREESKACIRDTLRDSIELLKKVLSIQKSPIELIGEFYDISANARIREIASDLWSWPSNQYLWIRPISGIGGIDIEIDHITLNELDFLRNNMLARKVDPEAAKEMIDRASDGVRYTVRLSAFQPAIMYLSLWSLVTALATTADGYVYTTDADWAAPMVPLSGHVLQKLLVEKRFRVQTGFQKDVENAQMAMRIG